MPKLMKLKPGKCSYPLTVKAGKLISALVIDPEKNDIRSDLQLLDLGGIIAQRQKDTSFGRPPHYSVPLYIALHNNILEIWPPPDKSYDCLVRYHPPPKEI